MPPDDFEGRIDEITDEIERKNQLVDRILSVAEDNRRDPVISRQLDILRHLEVQYTRQIRIVEQSTDFDNRVNQFLANSDNTFTALYDVLRRIAARNRELRLAVFRREQEAERRAAPGYVAENPADSEDVFGGSMPHHMERGSEFTIGMNRKSR